MKCQQRQKNLSVTRTIDSPYTYLAAVGVSFLLAVGLNRLLRQKKWYAKKPEPDLMQLLDLVALGTVCDVMPLIGLNRTYVCHGLKIMSKRNNLRANVGNTLF